MEDDRGSIEDYMHRYGYSVKEAEAMYHLNQARNLIREIYQAEAEARACRPRPAGGRTVALVA